MRKWAGVGSVVLALALTAGWSLWSGKTGGGDAADDALQALDDAQVAQSALPVRALEVISGKSSPSLAMPDAQGRLWLVQQLGGDRVSRRELDGSWTAVAGSGQRDGDGVAVSGCRAENSGGKLCIPDQDQLGDGGPALQARLQSPDSIALAPDGTLYVADTGHHVIRAVDPVTQRIRHVAGDGREVTLQSLPQPDSLLRTADGALWFVAGQHRARKVYRLVPETGQLDVAYVPSEATPQWGANRGGEYIADLAADEQGRIYIADNGNMRLLRLEAWRGPPANPRAPAATVLAGNGTLDVLRTDVPATQSPLGFISSMAISPQGQLYVYQEAVEGHLARLDAGTGRFVTVLPPEAWVKPPGQDAQRLGLRQARLRVGPQGMLYLADGKNDRVLLLQP